MSHPIWKGSISFGLVNIPVVLYSAEQSYELAFKLLDSRNLEKVRYQRINEKTGKEVPWDSIVKGYEYEKGSYAVVTDQDFKKVALENLKSIDIEDFVPAAQLPSPYISKPYYLVPDKKGDKGYVLLRETLKHTKKIGIARVMIRTRQYLAAIVPLDTALLVEILRYPQELRQLEEFEFPDKSIKEYKISKKEIEIAQQLVEAMSVEWDPERYNDDYHDKLLAWIEEKIASGNKKSITKEVKAPAAKKTNVVDFMDLLKKSISEKKKPTVRRGKIKSSNTKTRPRKASTKKTIRKRAK